VSFSEATGGRALSFRDISMGEPAGLPLDRAGAMRRGQDSPVDILLKRPAREPWSWRKAHPHFKIMAYAKLSIHQTSKIIRYFYPFF